MTSRSRILVLGLTALLVALPASAAVYTVTLHNGSTFETRYQPEQASWDPGKIVLLSEWGNRIALAVEDVASIATDTESRGFGHQLNNTTMALGWAPNDLVDPNSDEGKAAAAAEQAQAAIQALTPQVYDQQQFVEPTQTTGLPVWVTGVNAVPQVAPNQPQPVAPPQ